MTMQETLTLLPEWLIWWFNWLVFAVALLPLALLIWPQSRKVGVIAVAASILTGQMGYVKLLGLPHLLIWGPLAFYLFRKQAKDAMPIAARWIIRVILVTLLISLAFDVVDVLRYILGERTPLGSDA
jgi:hypothetical protein